MLHCICRAGPKIASESSSYNVHSILILIRRVSSRTHARAKNKQLVSSSIRPPFHMARSSRDDEAFRNAMTGLPHANSSTKAHASPSKLPVASPSARSAHPLPPQHNCCSTTQKHALTLLKHPPHIPHKPHPPPPPRPHIHLLRLRPRLPRRPRLPPRRSPSPTLRPSPPPRQPPLPPRRHPGMF